MSRDLQTRNLVCVVIALSALMFACGDGGGSSGGGRAASSSKSSASVAVSLTPTAELTAVAGSVLLLNFNGNTTDATARHAAADFGTSNDNVNFKFGTASRDFMGAQFVQFADHVDWDFAAADFTIEFWMRTNSAALGYVFGQWAAGCLVAGNTVTASINNAAGKVQVVINDAGVNRAITSTTTVTDNAWHHIKMQRTSNSLVLSVDGNAEGVALSGLGAVPGSANNFTVGRAGDCNASLYDGNLDDFRIVK